MSKGDKFLKWFFSGRGIVDERFKQELGKVATKTLMVFFGVQLIFLLGFGMYMFLAPIKDFETVAAILWICEMLGTSAIFLGMEFVLIHRKVFVQELPEAKAKKAIRHLKFEWALRALFFGIGYWLLTSWLEMGKAGYIAQLFKPESIRRGVLGFVLWGAMMYGIQRWQLRKAKEDD
ncbi:DUF3278 domain-containing protein [Lacticaseibacillus porcinae]|uniref:DUF3278 domain-containing protein n=1 Tax=Lacticaseibacillus porcinae TaxID=1123687 RepID=UPI0013DE732C|nr:DUF3278 domain-containing protein [Lacticaseibacillus porcinae]